MPRRRSAERGEGNLGCVVWVVLLAIGVLIAWKAVPVKVKSAEFYDYMDELAKFSAARATSDGLRKGLMDRAQQLDIPLERKNIDIELSREKVRMKVRYTIPVEFPGYTYNWDFEQEIDRPIFIV
jgi:hypothetical protein